LTKISNELKLVFLEGAYKLFNQEIKENLQIKKSIELEEIQTLRTLSIVWLCLGGASPLFFIIGLVFLLSSMVKAEPREAEKAIADGGQA